MTMAYILAIILITILFIIQTSKDILIHLRTEKESKLDDSDQLKMILAKVGLSSILTVLGAFFIYLELNTGKYLELIKTLTWIQFALTIILYVLFLLSGVVLLISDYKHNQQVNTNKTKWG